MTFTPTTPLPTDIPAESQSEFIINYGDLNSYFGVNHIPFGNAITGLSNTNPAVVTSPNHGQVTGATVQLNRVRGLIPGNENIEKYQTVWPVSNPYTITVIDKDTFSLNSFDTSNTATFPPYVVTSGDFSVTTAGYPYGYHTKLSFAVSQETPNLPPPAVSLYPQLVASILQLFFQNNNSASAIATLTGCKFAETKEGKGIKTPWGIILNMGQINFTGATVSHDFPMPYVNTPLTFLAYANGTTVVALVANITNNMAFTVSNGGAINSPAIPGYYICIGK